MGKKKGRKSREVRDPREKQKTDASGKLIRSPVFCILGHVDSGKTSLLDKVRGTVVQARETAGITQHIGASFIPAETINDVAGKLMKAMKIESLEIPGVLFVDTPGHASFINLRQRGASAANLAVLVVDLIRGIQPQTIESIRILKNNRVPFVIALNKIDRFPKWKSHPKMTMVQSLQAQSSRVIENIDNKIYELMTDLYDVAKVSADRFDRIKGSELTKKVVIIPTSAITGEGIPELFLFLAGLSQRFLTDKLKFDPEETGSGSILEVKEGHIGKTIDFLLLQGVMRKNDKIIFGGLNGVIETHIRALLVPKPLDEIRDPRERFNQVDQIIAAAGVKIVAPDTEGAIAGSTLYVVRETTNVSKLKKEIQEEFSKALIETEDEGIILKTDALGSLEALVGLLKDNNIPIRIASVGNITKRDVIEAELAKEKEEKYGTILSFNATTLPEAKDYADIVKVKIFTNDVIYRLVEEYQEWVRELEREEESALLKDLVFAGKIKVLPNIFRQNNPAVVGIEVLGGKLTPKAKLINSSNKRIGEVLQIKEENDYLQVASTGQQVGCSIKGPTVGRQLNIDDILYVDITETQAIKLQDPEIKALLSGPDLFALQDIIEIKRKFSGQRFWGAP
ncbi:MAG: putative translation initiation factor IF-2 [Candidatus Heimdallarchaeota archaeon LC_3]|nr:MAG: putative translation initiation factor IF-2 [Candidatus Heimdallarchaeota archaeon LC_3]